MLIQGMISMSFPVLAQKSFMEEIHAFQEELNEEFSDSKTSPLTKDDLKKFKALPFFSADTTFRVDAKFVRTENQTPFIMPTTTSRQPVYEKYGEAHFTLMGKNIVLTIYQSHDLRKTEEYKDYLFLPFTDLTNGLETYGGGRYIGLTIPPGEEIIIDFNKAYNPYCAYNPKYSCPLVPRENHIELAIEAGVKKFGH